MKKIDWILASLLGALAAVFYFATMADYFYPGESAQLIVAWRGLDSSAVMYPLAKSFAGLFGYGNAMAPVCGVITTVAIYFLVVFSVRARITGEGFLRVKESACRLGGVLAAVVFMLTPAVHEAATHLEPRLFDVMWACLSFLLFIPYLKAPKSIAWIFPLIISIMAAMGFADTPLFLLLLPVYFVLIWTITKKQGGLGYGAAAIFLFVFSLAFFVYAASATESVAQLIRFLKGLTQQYYTTRGWLTVFSLATLPFILILFSARRAFAEKSGWMQWCFHCTLSLVLILAIATPLSPSSIMQEMGILPVAAGTCVALTLGYVAVYWYLQIRSMWGENESLESDSISAIGRLIAYISAGVLAVAILFAMLLNVFASNLHAGRFADQVAEKILDDLGSRSWFITDGTLDNHLLLQAERRGKELNLVCLQRDLDKTYLEKLANRVKETNVGGERTDDLVISTSLGVLAFVQDWFTLDPDIAQKAAVFGAPDLWYSANKKPIPELFFFGADASRSPDWKLWHEKFNQVLSAPKGWGSYKLYEVTNPMTRMRLNLRRHVGLIANNEGVYLQDQGQDDEAFDLYELVLNDIDADNVCALFNEFELSRKGNKKALAKKKEIERKLKAIVDEADRRYRLWALANYYGYIRSPEIFLKLGFAWARSGRPGEALHQIRRAIDLVPSDKRRALVMMMAALYATENGQDKSRMLYEHMLASDATNHDALIGMMRLELLDGNEEKAIQYLEKATAAAGDDPQLQIEVALLHLMRTELDQAHAILRKITETDASNLQAWSLLAAVTIQQIDAAKDENVKNKLLQYLEENILATMEKQARSSADYHLQTTRAFILLRKKEDRRREARDALIAAARLRPDIQATGDMILGLDISLNDTVDAERQAREMLRRNRQAPLANYVMGSLALQNARYKEAETFLRRAAEAPKPVVLALNDLAEVLRRKKEYQEAEKYVRRAIEVDPNLYVSWETLGAILLDSNGNLDEAEACIAKACELSKDKNGQEADVRMLISLARVQMARGDTTRAKVTFRKVNARRNELSEFERREFEELRKDVR